MASFCAAGAIVQAGRLERLAANASVAAQAGLIGTDAYQRISADAPSSEQLPSTGGPGSGTGPGGA